MKQDRHYLAFDLGASSGRAILGSVRDGRLGPRWAAAWAASPALVAVPPALLPVVWGCLRWAAAWAAV